jgi:hypothetical protein
MVLARCFSEEKVWSAVLVGFSAILVSIDCPFAAIYCARTTTTATATKHMQSDSTKKSFNNF